MLYLAYQAHTDLVEPAKTLARSSLAMLGSWGSQVNVPIVRNLSAAYELIARAGLTHARPEYAIPAVTVGNREVEVTEEPVLTLPFGTLLRFKKDIDLEQPRVLVVAPLSVTSRRCCATRCARYFRIMTSTSPIGTTRAT